MNTKNFPTNYNEILDRIDQVDVLAYAKTRNYQNGAVSRLSPYISRGVISLPQIRDRVLRRYTSEQAYAFIFELAWREYFQRVWWQLGDAIHTDIKAPQQQVVYHHVADALSNANLGINAMDDALRELSETGYMHNHLRMYTAAIACNVGKAHWAEPAAWLYYHLLDGDIASNTLSWQWVAGSFSSKKYYCNQENINKYCGTSDRKTFMDHSYEALPNMPVPEVLKTGEKFGVKTILPKTDAPTIDTNLPIVLYNSYNLDPQFCSEHSANRILLLEPSHFEQFPVSERVLSFVLDLAKSIKGIQVFTGELSEIPYLDQAPATYSKAHPAFKHYPGTPSEPEWMFPSVNKIGGSFMSFWKQCERQL